MDLSKLFKILVNTIISEELPVKAVEHLVLAYLATLEEADEEVGFASDTEVVLLDAYFAALAANVPGMDRERAAQWFTMPEALPECPLPVVLLHAVATKMAARDAAEAQVMQRMAAAQVHT